MEASLERLAARDSLAFAHILLYLDTHSLLNLMACNRHLYAQVRFNRRTWRRQREQQRFAHLCRGLWCVESEAHNN